MKTSASIPVGIYKLALLATTLIWGGSFVVLKDTLNALDVTWLLTIRFAAAGLICLAFFWKRLMQSFDLSHLLAGTLIGLSGGLAFLVQNIGLASTTPAKNAFLTATYCVMVPFLYWAARNKRPALHNVAAALLCIAGVCLVTVGSNPSNLGAAFKMGTGDLLTLVSAFLFAVNIVLVAILALAHDLRTLIVIQLFVFAAVCAIAGLIARAPLPAAKLFSADLIGKLSFLVLLGTVFATMMQNLGQKYVDPSQAALIMSFESVFGVLFSVIFYHEAVTPLMLAGFASIFISILISELVGGRHERHRQKEQLSTTVEYNS